MQRTTAVTVGVLFALAVVLVLVLGRGSSRPPAKPVAAKPLTSVSSQPAVSAALPAGSAAPSAGADDDALLAAGGSEGFDTLPDGRKVPELPATAPKSVGFGVVLVTYEGAQSAPKDARSKAEAKQKAQALLEEAKHDFAAAVAHGDRGSTADAGHVPRGVLEPAVEYPIFLLEKRSVHPEPIDTPRGYWIVRRND